MIEKIEVYQNLTKSYDLKSKMSLKPIGRVSRLNLDDWC